MSNEFPSTMWPKTYLLEVYNQAVSKGCIRLDFGGDAVKARGFMGSFYRFRRSADRSSKAFVRPEFHLVQCTWEPRRGTVLVTYSSLPDGHELPQLMDVEAGEQFAGQQDYVPQLAAWQAPTNEPEIDSEQLVEDLMAETLRRIQDTGDEQ
jgi:hypothetical protein